MTRRIERVLNKNPYLNADTQNYEKFPSYTPEDKDAYLQMVMTNTMGNTFYASAQELANSSLKLHERMAQTDPSFMSDAIVYARNKGFMRLQPITGLAYLAKANPFFFKLAFDEVIQTPGDLQDFVEIMRSLGGMGRSIKTMVNRWLNRMSEYHAIKYASGGQGYSLRDILRLTHPKPASKKQEAIFKWLIDSEAWREIKVSAVAEKGEQIYWLEQLKGWPNGGQEFPEVFTPEAQRWCITKGRLPYEVVTGIIKPDAATWEVLMKEMPYFALLRHLETLRKAGVFQSNENVEYVTTRLLDVDAMKKAKVLPFRLLSARRQFEAADYQTQAIVQALFTALDNSFMNVPHLPGKIVVAPDVSGSMRGASAFGDLTCIDIAALLGAALFKGNQALLIPFNDRALPMRVNQNDSLTTIANQIGNMPSGGTALDAPLAYMLANGIDADVFIGITDNEEWAGSGFLPVWRQYRKTHPQAKAFLLTVAPYAHRPTPKDEPGVFYVYGWNDTVLSYIATMAPQDTPTLQI